MISTRNLGMSGWSSRYAARFSFWSSSSLAGAFIAGGGGAFLALVVRLSLVTASCPPACAQAEQPGLSAGGNQLLLRLQLPAMLRRAQLAWM